MHVALLGLGPTAKQFISTVGPMGGIHAFCDEVWGINQAGDIWPCDRVFHMDDVRMQEARAALKPTGAIAAMLRWMKGYDGLVYTSRAHPDYPCLQEYPLEDVINDLGYVYFNSTAAYAIALAIHLKVKKLSLFGLDFTYANVYQAEKGRACCEFWLGHAAARGIELSMPHETSLLDACEPEKFYGYDTRSVEIVQGDGRLRVAFAERHPWPTAEEIEARYDHSAHPNPLVAKESP